MPEDMGQDWAEDLIESDEPVAVTDSGENVEPDHPEAGQLVKDSTWA